MIHTRIKARKAWLDELWEYCVQNSHDEEVAKIQYKRLVFEEQ